MKSDRLNKYISKGFKPLSSGPEYYDCYSLSSAIVLDECGVMLPSQPELQSSKPIAVHDSWAKERIKAGWRRLDKPEKYATVFMAKRDGLFCHVGTVVDEKNPSILHVSFNTKSAVHSIRKIRMLFGFVTFEYWKYGNSY